MGVYTNAVFADNPIHYWRCFENFGALALEDIGAQTSYLYAGGPPAEIATQPPWPPPGLGWSGPASDGGSCAMSAGGFRNAIPASGVNPDPPGASLPVPGTLECWFWGADAFGGTSLVWWLPGNPVNQQSIGMTFHFSQIQVEIFGTDFVTFSMPWSTNWHHCVMVMTAPGAQLYVDGNSVGSVAHALTGRTAATNFAMGVGLDTEITGLQNGFLSEIAIYNTALGAGQVANHFNAGDSRTNAPSYYGTRPATVSSPLGYHLGTAHTGLTTTGSFSPAGGTVALLISVTIDTPEHGMIVGNPDYLLSRGYVNASNALGTVYQFDRLVFGTQVRELPRFTSVVSWAFPPNLVVSITELSVH